MFVICRRWTIFRFALVGAILAGITLALLMAVSPELHEFVHHDQDDDADGHQCLVTLIQAGGCDDTVPEAFVVTAFFTTLFETVPIGKTALVESVFASGSVFEHAPPFVS